MSTLARRRALGLAVAHRLAHATGLAIVAATLAGAAASPAHAVTPPVDEDYTLHCSACHGADGAGVPERVPSLQAVGVIAARPGGRDYLMRVPGAAQSPLSDARLARLLEWVVLRFGDARVEPPITAEEVGAARRSPLRDPARVRARVMAGE